MRPRPPEAVISGRNPYRCAQSGLRYLLHVSGGRTSGMLLYRMLAAYEGRLPANVRAVFANHRQGTREDARVHPRDAAPVAGADRVGRVRIPRRCPRRYPLITQYPERADWWIEQERYRRSVARRVRKPELTRFLMRYTYEDLKNTPMMPFDELREEQEASEAVSCFCGD